jgi:hypothetical protein
MKFRKNERGNQIMDLWRHTERYEFDFERCTSKKGWKQYDTREDAWYFGVWVHEKRRLILTYAEGDITIVRCKTEASYHAELRHMADFYGPPPPAFKTIDYPSGEMTEFYDTRPV